MNTSPRGLFTQGADLFSSAGQTSASDLPLQPLAVRMRPHTWEEIAGQQHLLRPGSPLRRLVSSAADSVGMVSVILWGPPGTGKTTLAHVIAGGTGAEFVELSAVTAGVKDVRQVMETARNQRDLHHRRTVLFLDEIHRFSKSQQDALLPGVENGWVTLVAATTENPSFSVIAPLLSRSLMLTLQPLTEQDLQQLLDRALSAEAGLAGRFRLHEDAQAHLLRLASGDARRLLTSLEAAAGIAESTQLPPSAAGPSEPAPTGAGQRDGLAAGASPATTPVTEQSEPGQQELAGQQPGSGSATIEITLETAEQAVAVAAVRYDKDGDQHYDVISAFIKSIRGSDADAALHYLARMIHAGEDPRFIARRLMISASEDIGLADPSALTTAVAAAQAVALVGLPEARIILAQAVIHLATTAKSNSAYLAIEAALADVQAGRAGQVPPHLRDSHYPGAKKLGHGKGYLYAHDQEHAIAAQQYLPDTLVGMNYYHPNVRGYESQVSQRWERIQAILHTHRPSPDQN